jgi:hypothetical protein
MSDAALPRDPLAAARANIRDTVKWLIAAFAGMAAAIVGGSPLTGLGTPMPDWRIVLAVASGVIGLLLVAQGITVALRILVTPPFFMSDITDDADLLGVINAHVDDLLPPPFTDFGAFVAKRSEARAVVRRVSAIDPADTDADKKRKEGERLNAQTFLDNSGLWADRLISFAYFEKLRRQLQGAATQLFEVAFLAALAFSVFAWAANPGKDDAKPGPATPITRDADFI